METEQFKFDSRSKSERTGPKNTDVKLKAMRSTSLSHGVGPLCLCGGVCVCVCVCERVSICGCVLKCVCVCVVTLVVTSSAQQFGCSHTLMNLYLYLFLYRS